MQQLSELMGVHPVPKRRRTTLQADLVAEPPAETLAVVELIRCIRSVHSPLLYLVK